MNLLKSNRITSQALESSSQEDNLQSGMQANAEPKISNHYFTENVISETTNNTAISTNRSALCSSAAIKAGVSKKSRNLSKVKSQTKLST